MKKFKFECLLVFFTCALLCLAIAGCTIGKKGKWSMGYRASGANVPGGALTASVGYFQNQALQVNPLLANALTEALKDKILSNTSLKLVNGTGTGDVNFEGIIENYVTTQPMAPQAGSDPTGALNRYSITIKVKYYNVKDQQYDFDYSSFTRFVDYKATLTPEAAERANMDDLVKELVDDVFNKAFVNW